MFNNALDELDSTPITSFNTDEDVIRKIERSVENWYEYFGDNITNGYEDARFALGDQWGQSEISDYMQRQKIRLTINMLYSFITNIVGQQKQNSPQLQVRALNNNIDQKKIKVIEGILREVAYSSKSDNAYQLGFYNALMQGFGAWRVAVDYRSPESFDKDLFIMPIVNASLAYFDSSSVDPTRCDGEYCGCYTKISHELFKKLYPEIELPQSMSVKNIITGLMPFNWNDQKGITMVEHFHKERIKTKIYKLSNGDCVKKDDLDKRMKELKEIRDIYTARLHSVYMMSLKNGLQATPPPKLEDIKIVDERETELVKIKHYKAIKDHVLEEAYFPGSELPIIMCDGDSNYFDSKIETRSFIRNAKDSQRFVNMIMSDLANMAKLGHKGEFMATEAQIGNYKEIWRNPEKYNMARLWKPDPLAPGDKPQYIPPADLPPGLTSQISNLFNTMQISLGRFEANRGDQGNEQSGRAIANRAKQGDTAVFTYLDNLNKAIEQTGRVCLSAMPYVFENRDQINGRNRDGTSIVIDLKDKENENVLKQKDVDISVTIGAAFELQKQEQFAQLMAVTQALQLPSNIIADLVVENTNLANTPQLLERVKDFVMSPQVVAKENGQQPPPQPPNPMMEIEQKKAQAQLLEAQSKIMKTQAEIQQLPMEQRIATIKADAEINKAALDYKSKAEEHAVNAHLKHLEVMGRHADHANAHLQRQHEQHNRMMDLVERNAQG